MENSENNNPEADQKGSLQDEKHEKGGIGIVAAIVVGVIILLVIVKMCMK